MLISYIQNTKHVTFYPFLPISVTVSIFTVCDSIFLTLTPNIPQYVTISPTALNWIYSASGNPPESLPVRCAVMPHNEH